MSDPQAPLWRFIALTNYSSPAGPTTQTVRNNFRDLMRRLGVLDRAAQESEIADRQETLETIPAYLIARAAPDPDWRSLHLDALNESEQWWLEAEPAQAGLRVLINAPHSVLPESARAWAEDHACRVIEPPSPQQILEDDVEWLALSQAANDRHWVLPCLERSFLRHQNGFSLLRRWLDWAAAHPHGLVICDSWAWSFLCRTLHVDQILPPARTLAPLDADGLRRWFRQLANENGPVVYTFRQADSGKLIYAQEDVDEDGNQREDETDYLKYLAARSRGIPEIAWRIWRHSLLVESDEAVEEGAEEKASTDRGRTIWVRPWDQLELPAVPGHFSANEALVLHALLLHDGLADTLLARLLPLASSEIASSVSRLQTANLVNHDSDCRRVTGLGYLAVRGFLRTEGFLTDEL